MKTIINQQNSSNVYDLSTLKNDGKIFIMDNHMAAGWCWAQKIDFEKSYSLFHVDKHYDLLEGGLERNVNAISNQNFNLKKSTIEEYCSLTYPKGFQNEKNQVFRFDNYMTIIKKLYPKIFDKIIFATHKDGTIPKDWWNTFYEAEIVDLTTGNIEYWINEQEKKWIFNIDIDYFFTKNSNDEYFQFLTDEYILDFIRQIKKIWSKIEVLTIALSPSFCGGIKNSERISDIILNELTKPN